MKYVCHYFPQMVAVVEAWMLLCILIARGNLNYACAKGSLNAKPELIVLMSHCDLLLLISLNS